MLAHDRCTSWAVFSETVLSMKLAATVSILSALGLCQLRAEEAISQNRSLAPVERKSENLPAGSCMPIGLTARGNIVFPWECRELIEKQRGPVSEDIQNPPKDSASKEPAKEAASQDARPEPVVVAPEQSSVPPKASATDDHQSASRSRRRLSSQHRRGPDDAAAQSAPKFTGAIK